MKRLYELIWKRTMASQMEGAMLERTTIDFRDTKSPTELRATGQVVLFDGFLTLYQEGKDDEEDEESRRLPKLEIGQSWKSSTPRPISISPSRRRVIRKPASSRSSKSSASAAHRPTPHAREIARARLCAYGPQPLLPGRQGSPRHRVLENFFHRYVEYDFTADLEAKLDDISAGTLTWKQFLARFWTQFSFDVGEMKDLRVTHVLDALNETLGPHVSPRARTAPIRAPANRAAPANSR